MRVASAASQGRERGVESGFRRIIGAWRPRLWAWSGYLLVLVMPSSLFWPVVNPLIVGVFLPYVTPGLFLPDAAVALLFLSLIAYGRKLNAGPLEIAAPLAGLCILALLTAPWSRSTPLALYSTARWLIAACVYLYFAQPLASRGWISTMFLAGLCLQTVVGLGQVAAKGPLGLPGEMAFANSAELAWTFRAFGFTFHPNVLGGFLTIGLLLSIPLLKRRVILAGWWLAWLGLAATFSRSAWIAAAVTVPLALLWQLKWKPDMRRSLTVALIGLVVVIGLAGIIWREQMAIRFQPLLAQAQGALNSLVAADPAPPSVVSDAAEIDLSDPLSSSNYAISERFVQFELAFMAIQESPLHGVGAGNFPAFMAQLNLIVAPNFVHNVPLMLAAEIGVLGAGLWLVLCLVMGWWLIKYWRMGNSWFIVALCAGLALAAIAMFDFYPWGLNTGRLLTAMVLGFIARSHPNRNGPAERGS